MTVQEIKAPCAAIAADSSLLFPGSALAITAQLKHELCAFKAAAAQGRVIIVFARDPGAQPKLQAVHPLAVLGRVLYVKAFIGKSLIMAVQGLQRVNLSRIAAAADGVIYAHGRLQVKPSRLENEDELINAALPLMRKAAPKAQLDPKASLYDLCDLVAQYLEDLTQQQRFALLDSQDTAEKWRSLAALIGRF